MANKRQYALTELTTKDLAALVGVDKSTYSEKKCQSVENILRTRVSNTQSSSASNVEVSYNGYEQVALTLSGTGTVNIQPKEIPNNSVVYLSISKPLSTIVTFSGYYGQSLNSEVGSSVGNTNMRFCITSISGNLNVVRLDSYKSGSMTSDKLTSTYGGSITSFSSFNYYVNGNIYNFNIAFGFTTNISTDLIIVSIADLPFTFKNVYNISATSGHTTATSFIDGVAIFIGSTILELKYSETLPVGDEIDVKITGSFIIN